MKDKIIQWIEEYQRGKVGIYPYRLSELVAIEFYIPIKEAAEFVLEHIKKEFAKLEEGGRHD